MDKSISLAQPQPFLNALTFDVEEHFQVHAVEDVISRRDWDSMSSRVVTNTMRVLNLLDEHSTKATFFVLGWVADRYPGLVLEIHERGHELATHGYWHRLLYSLSPEEFRTDLRLSLDSIERASGCGYQLGHRAPAFSVTSESMWALRVLRDEGVAFDSSIFPIGMHDRYGVPDAPREIYEAVRGLWEIPMSTITKANRNWPVAGGGYFRAYPLTVTRWALQSLNAEGLPAVVYLHPWEFDPEQPRVRGLPATSRFRHYLNLSGTAGKLRRLLSEFRFAPIREVFASQLGAADWQPDLAQSA